MTRKVYSNVEMYEIGRLRSYASVDKAGFDIRYVIAP